MPLPRRGRLGGGVTQRLPSRGKGKAKAPEKEMGPSRCLCSLQRRERVSEDRGTIGWCSCPHAKEACQQPSLRFERDLILEGRCHASFADWGMNTNQSFHSLLPHHRLHVYGFAVRLLSAVR